MVKDSKWEVLWGFYNFCIKSPILVAQLRALCIGRKLSFQMGHKIHYIQRLSVTLINEGKCHLEVQYLIEIIVHLAQEMNIRFSHISPEGHKVADLQANIWYKDEGYKFLMAGASRFGQRT